jgi:hypothetical protein
MGNDDGAELGGVVVPLSLIQLLSEGMLELIDRWHEERKIKDLDITQCVVAMMAAVDAAAEALHGYPDGETLQ